MFPRIIVIINHTPWEITLRERLLLKPPLDELDLGHHIRVLPSSRREFPASHFLNRNLAFLLPSRIAIEVDGTEVESFISHDFLKYVKITFGTDAGGNLVVRVVRPRLRDLCRIWGFGFLGRTYHGRPEDTIMECAIRNQDIAMASTNAEDNEANSCIP